jgi:Domain of unknown function (DUF4202)
MWRPHRANVTLMTDPSPGASRFARAVEQIDAAHAEDPNHLPFEGGTLPAELLYARRMTQWLTRLEPAASEALRLAVRCQHLRRWSIPRASYPMSRPGYLQWRSALARSHAEQAAEILRGVGYDEPTVARVQSLVRKERLSSDREAQALEDAACLVFLEGEFVEFSRRHDEAKVEGILRKTWRKMSERGRAAALELVNSLPPRERELIERAVPAVPSPGTPGEG